MIVFCAPETAAAQSEATVLFATSTIIRCTGVSLLILAGGTTWRISRCCIAVSRRSGRLACLLVPLDDTIKGRQCGVLDGTQFLLQGMVGGADLEHHAYQIIHSDCSAVCFIDEGKQTIPELDN